MTDEILFSVQNGLGIIQLNRPAALNALNHAMCVPLEKTLRQWSTDTAIKAVLIKGTGEKAFCAGGDIRHLTAPGEEGKAGARAFWSTEYRANTLIAEMRKPFIALIDGIFMGGGVGLSVHGSHRVISEQALFAMPETGIGLFPDVGGTYFLPRLKGELGTYLGLTGARLKSADVLHAGIATHSVKRADHAALEAALIAAPLTDKASVDAVIMPFQHDPGPAPLAPHLGLIDLLFAGDSVAEVMQQLDASDGFGVEQAKLIRTKSPTSVKLTFAQLRRGRSLNFRDCMKLEWRMCNHVLGGHDFYEGVRAVIVDKDHAPRWQPATLEEVSDAYIESYFAALPDGDLLFD